MYKKRLEQLQKKMLQVKNLVTKDDETALINQELSYLELLVDRILSVVEKTVKYHLLMSALNSFCEKDVDSAIRELNQQKVNSISYLDMAINIINRLSMKYLNEPFYEGSQSEVAIMEFAFDLLQEYSPSNTY